ncbi:Zinc finger protein 40 [Trichinella nelsoni]|uniref:Zinc finger protein 40 n=1 Tax=Trichinella nelsoni TaxID=6336 RepID=A0A0V0SDV1_9BILA|nr:Zinc finger protein 40 [Trichinella nelsoni]
MESVVVYACVVFVQFFFDVSFIAPVGWLSATSMTPTIDNVDRRSLALVLAADQEADCQNRIMVDVAPVVGSGTSSSSTVETVSVDGRSAFLARQTSLGEQADTFNAAAALYSQYAVIQQQYTAALAAVARAAAAAAASRSNSTGSGCLAPSMPYPYFIATGQQFVSNLSLSTASAAATTASDSVVIENSSAKRKRSLTGRLSSNNTGDSSALNEQQQQQQQPSSSSSSSSVCCFLLQSTSTTASSNNNTATTTTTTTTNNNNNNNNNNSSSSVEKIFSTAGRESPAMGATRVNHKAVEEHISRLISENEALLEPSPVLLKRRSYTRQHFGSFDQGSSTGGHRNVNANAAVCSAKQKGSSSNSSNNCNTVSSSSNVKTMRSQSLVDAELLLSTFKRKSSPSPDDLHRGFHRSSVDCGRLRNRTDRGSLSPRSASVEAVHQVSTGKQGSALCAYCSVGFRNVDACKAHEIRCAQRPSLSSIESSPAPIVEASSPLSCSSSCCSSSCCCSSSSTSFCSANTSSTFSSNVIFALQLGNSTSTPMQPYCNTVRVPKLLDLEPMRSTQNQPSLITQSTFCTVRRRPVPQQKLAIARQSIWLDGIPQSTLNISSTGDDTERRTDTADAHFNILLMGCYRLQKLHHMPLLCYTTAVQEFAHSMRMTHSSYWKYSKKLRKLSKLDHPPTTAAIAIINNGNSNTITSNNNNNNNCTSLVLQLKVDQCQQQQQNSEKNDTSNDCTISSWQRSSVDDETFQRNQNFSSAIKKGRGRGRYVCDRCGIRCKKPSVLKKHFRCHLDIRPYSCPLCMFSFKSKGNLTKHMKSKAHSRRSSQQALTAVIDSTTIPNTIASTSSSSSLSSTIRQTSTTSLIITLAEGMEPGTQSTINQIQKINVEQQFAKSDEETSSASEMFEDFYYDNWKHDAMDTSNRSRYFKQGCRSHTPSELAAYSEDDDEEPERCSSAPLILRSDGGVTAGDYCPKTADSTDAVSSGKPATNRDRAAINFPLVDARPNSDNSKQLNQQPTPALEEAEQQRQEELVLGEKENNSIIAAAVAAAACTASVGPGQNGDSGGLAPAPAVGGGAVAHDFDKFYSSMTAEGRLECPICGKRFNKYSLLRLHENVHAFEQSNRKGRHDLKCSECHCSFRSRTLLQKHMLNAHPVDVDQQTVELTDRRNHCSLNGHHDGGGAKRPAAAESPGGAQWSTTPKRHAAVNASASNPRPFQCADCDSAFRIHGHLAKHLRSKLHIMKLESVGKLPVGTFAKIEELGMHSFHDMDTSSSENALRSLLRILANSTTADGNQQQQQQQQQLNTKVDTKCRLGTEEPTPVGEVTNSGAVGVASSITAETGDDDDNDGDETLIDVEALPPPPQPSTEKRSKVASPNPPEPVGSMKLARELPSQPGAGRSVVAGLWVPPTSDQLISAAASCRLPAHVATAPVPVDTTVASSFFSSSSTSCSSSSSSSCSSTFNDHAVVDSATGKSLDNVHAVNSETERGEISCGWCQVCFPSVVDLEIHMHTDHILMRDGRDYRCTLANCDKIYPNMDCLRQHVKLHFVAGSEQLATAADLVTDSRRQYNHHHHHYHQQQQQPTTTTTTMATATAAVLPPSTSTFKPTLPKRTRRTGHNNSNKLLDHHQQQQQHRTTMNYKDSAGGGGVVVLIHGGQIQNSRSTTSSSSSSSNTNTNKSNACISSPTSDSEASRSSAFSRSCGSPAAASPVGMESSASAVGACIPTDLSSEASRSAFSVSNGAGAAPLRRCSSLKRRSSLITSSNGSNSGSSTPLFSAAVQHSGTSPLAPGKRARISSVGNKDFFTTTTTNSSNSIHNSVVEQNKLLTSKIQQTSDLQAATPSLPSIPSCSAFLPVSSSLQHFAWNQPISPHLGLTGPNSHPLLFAGRELLLPQPHPLVTGGGPSMPVPAPAPGFSPLHLSHFYDQLWAASVLNAVQNYAGLAAAATPISPTVVAAAAAAAAAATAACGASTTTTTSSITTTTQNSNNNNNLLVCFICCKQCSNVIDLQEHMLGHSQPRPYVCEFCDAGFTSIRALQAHRPCRLQNVMPMS